MLLTASVYVMKCIYLFIYLFNLSAALNEMFSSGKAYGATEQCTFSMFPDNQFVNKCVKYNYYIFQLYIINRSLNAQVTTKATHKITEP